MNCEPKGAVMGMLVCMFHKEYDGKTPPRLSCKTCCGIYLDRVKSETQKFTLSPLETYEWLENKKVKNSVVKNLDHKQNHILV